MSPAIGYGVRRENRLILDDPAIDAAEITYEHADNPLRTGSFLGAQEFRYVSIHALELSVASPDLPPRRYLEGLLAVADENGASAISDHLGFTRDHGSGVAMGHFAPPPFSRAALDAVCRNVDHIQQRAGERPFFLETIAYLVKFRGELSEAEFLAKVLQRTGCGWLLDVTNVYANGLNHGFDPYEFIRYAAPAATRVQMHLAGGKWDEQAQFYFDSHSEPLSEPIWDLYRFAIDLLGHKTDAVFIERDANYPSDEGWRSEARRARQIAESKVTTP
jgi:uncharacterized protein (UPF0276 family)